MHTRMGAGELQRQRLGWYPKKEHPAYRHNRSEFTVTHGDAMLDEPARSLGLQAKARLWGRRSLPLTSSHLLDHWRVP